jgi:hypothetical protein
MRVLRRPIETAVGSGRSLPCMTMLQCDRPKSAKIGRRRRRALARTLFPEAAFGGSLATCFRYHRHIIERLHHDFHACEIRASETQP